MIKPNHLLILYLLVALLNALSNFENDPIAHEVIFSVLIAYDI